MNLQGITLIENIKKFYSLLQEVYQKILILIKKNLLLLKNLRLFHINLQFKINYLFSILTTLLDKLFNQLQKDKMIIKFILKQKKKQGLKKIIQFQKILMMMNNSKRYLHKIFLKTVHLTACSLRIIIKNPRMRERLELNLSLFRKVMRSISLIPKNIKFIQLFPNL